MTTEVRTQSRSAHGFLRRMASHLLFRLSEHLPDVPFSVTFWDGTTEQYGRGAPLFRVTVKTLAAARRVLSDGGLGFGEEHMEGNIDIEGDLRELFKLQYTSVFNASALTPWQKLRAVLTAFVDRNTPKRVRRNVAHHYDLSADFYRLWLDKSMTYTCAYFRTSHDTLEEAQNNKHEHICRKLQLEPGMTLVDIGCGWGAMMLYAAERYGVRCTGYTISEEQYRLLRERIKERGLEDRVEVLLKDYREGTGQFDRWVSIGMFEQVGREYIRTFMKIVKRMLKPGGLGVLHTIGFMFPNARAPWLTRYIFPGGYLPTLAQIVGPMNDLNLSVYDVEDLRLHYGETLDHWDRRFCQHIDKIREMYGERFVRMWRLYLNGVASAFRFGGARLYQIAFANGRDNRMFRTRAYQYGDGDVPRFNVPNLDYARR